MSVIGHLRRLSDAKLTRLFAEPAAIGEYLAREGSPNGGDDEVFADLAIDKAWHAIHFMLNGSAWEARGDLGFLVVGGRDVGDEGIGYGPARGFLAAEVRQIAQALEPVTGEMLLAGYDAAAMIASDVYPGGWPARRKGDPDFMRGFVDYFTQVKTFTTDAARNGEALLVFLK